jgi:lipid-binding SYLF domain-containing protein
MKRRFSSYLGVSIVALAMLLLSVTIASAESASEIDQDVDGALKKLYAASPSAVELAPVANGILMFPDVIKGGLIVGGQYGKGALLEGGQTVGYYNTAAASCGLQAGAQEFGYAMYFMTNKALDYLKNSNGWEIGVGPSVVVVDESMARALTTTTAKEDIYVFFFAQKGLMAGLGVQGSKITQIHLDK